jgi:hypothetical protein
MEKVKKTPKEAMMNVVEEREMAKSSQNMENMQFLGRTPNFQPRVGHHKAGGKPIGN